MIARINSRRRMYVCHSIRYSANKKAGTANSRATTMPGTRRVKFAFMPK